MRVPLSWLREYVDFDWSAEDLAARLTGLGMEVQSIERVGGDWRGVVVGELLDVGPHPNTQRLLLARVTIGAGDPLTIVCGAHNIAVGQRVPVAVPGAVLPGGRAIESTRIAGAASEGMLCSGAELGLTDDAEGILILSADGSGPDLGTPLEDMAADTVLDVDVKPNRGDALSLIGLAREVAALTGGEVHWPEVSVPEAGDATSEHLSVSVEASDLCRRFVGRYVDGLSVGLSPLAVQLRLGAAGMRPVSNVVDASNYVMLELGKPIHAFDAAAVSEGRIIVRRARDGEQLETLDHVVRTLSGDDLLIADPTGAIGIAGVMGGAASEVGDATRAVAIESAIFDAVAIRRTAQRHGLRSEASMRFEKGQEWRLARIGADRTAQLLAEWAGGRVATGVVDTDPSVEQPRRVPFRPARVNRLLGSDLEAAQMRYLLGRAEIEIEPAAASDRVTVISGDEPLDVAADDAALAAIVPTHRHDIAIEADLAEEVARLYGYEALPRYLPASETPAYRPDPRRLVDDLRVLLSGRGLSEVLTYALIAPADHARLGYAADDEATIRISNPLSVEHSEMRRSMLPGMVHALVANERRRRDDVALYELGPVHHYVAGEPRQEERLAILLAGDWQLPAWAQPARAADVYDAKGIVEWLFERLLHRRPTYRATRPLAGVEHPGRIAEVLAGDEDEPTVVGRVGELDPRYLAGYGVRAERAAVAVLDMATLAALVSPVDLPPLARAPAVERDVAVVVARSTPAGEVAGLIRRTVGEALVGLTLFDRYHGAPLATDEVSLAFRLRIQPSAQPMTDEEIEAVMRALGDDLRTTLGARIRGADEG